MNGEKPTNFIVSENGFPMTTFIISYPIHYKNHKNLKIEVRSMYKGPHDKVMLAPKV